MKGGLNSNIRFLIFVTHYWPIRFSAGFKVFDFCTNMLRWLFRNIDKEVSFFGWKSDTVLNNFLCLYNKIKFFCFSIYIKFWLPQKKNFFGKSINIMLIYLLGYFTVQKFFKKLLQSTMTKIVHLGSTGNFFGNIINIVFMYLLVSFIVQYQKTYYSRPRVMMARHFRVKNGLLGWTRFFLAKLLI